jgi:hypothetical protein
LRHFVGHGIAIPLPPSKIYVAEFSFNKSNHPVLFIPVVSGFEERNPTPKSFVRFLSYAVC